MNRFRQQAVAVLAVALVGALASGAAAQGKGKALKPTGEWRGSVDDLALLKKSPPQSYITDQKTFAALWGAWKVGPKLPKIDFAKEIVLIATTQGSNVGLTARLGEKGDLKVDSVATSDLGVGFRYRIVSVPREGVKSINGKPLPK
jgi:hypothetical protein